LCDCFFYSSTSALETVSFTGRVSCKVHVILNDAVLGKQEGFLLWMDTSWEVGALCLEGITVKLTSKDVYKCSSWVIVGLVYFCFILIDYKCRYGTVFVVRFPE